MGSRPPYGYSKKSEPHKAWLEIDENESRVVRLIFQWFLYGDEENGPLSMNAITRKLTALGIPTRGDKRKHVAKKRGKGVWHFGKTKMVNDKKSYNRPRKDKRGPGKQVPNERENWIPVEVPAIIDQADFARAQEQIRINQKSAPKLPNINILWDVT